jgi:hypothetical protein
MMKSLSRKEHKIFLKKMLKPYHLRIIEGSFLQRIYGHYKLTYNGKYVRVMILKNPFINSDPILEVNSSKSSTDFINYLNLDPDVNPPFSLIHEERLKYIQIIDKDLSFLKSLQILNFMIFIYAQRSQPENYLNFLARNNESLVYLCISIILFLSKNQRKKKSRELVDPDDSFGEIKVALSELITY